MEARAIINSTQAVILAERVLDEWEALNKGNPWIREPRSVQYARSVLKSAKGRIRMAVQLQERGII